MELLRQQQREQPTQERLPRLEWTEGEMRKARADYKESYDMLLDAERGAQGERPMRIVVWWRRFAGTQELAARLHWAGVEYLQAFATYSESIHMLSREASKGVDERPWGKRRFLEWCWKKATDVAVIVTVCFAALTYFG